MTLSKSSLVKRFTRRFTRRFVISPLDDHLAPDSNECGHCASGSQTDSHEHECTMHYNALVRCSSGTQRITEENTFLTRFSGRLFGRLNLLDSSDRLLH